MGQRGVLGSFFTITGQTDSAWEGTVLIIRNTPKSQADGRTGKRAFGEVSSWYTGGRTDDDRRLGWAEEAFFCLSALVRDRSGGLSTEYVLLYMRRLDVHGPSRGKES